MSEGGTIESALQKLGPSPARKSQGLLGDIEPLNDAIRRYPWTTLATFKGDQQVVRKIEETEKLLKDLKKALSK